MFTGLLVVTGILAFLSLFLTLPPAAHSQQARFTNVNAIVHPQPLVFSIPLLEAGNIRAGPLKVHPHFGIAQSYTDNIFRTDPTRGGRRSDWYTTYAPGLQVRLPLLGRHKLVFDYRSNIERYDKNSSQDIEDQTIAGNLLLDFPGGLSIKGIGEIKNGHFYRGTAEATPSTRSNEPNRFYTPNGGVEVLFARQAFIRAQYRYLDWQFIGPQAGPSGGGISGDINRRNRIENYWTLAMGRLVAPKTYLFLDSRIWRTLYQFNKELDSTTYNAGLGVTWEVTGKTVGDFSFGWQQKNYDRASSVRASDNFNSVAFRGRMLWTPQEQTQVNVSLIRTTKETVVLETRFFVRTGVSLQVNHALTHKWRATGQFGYNHDSYSDPITLGGKTQKRKDNYTTLGAGVEYQIQPWLGARASYTYQERLSNFISNQYVASVWMVSAQAQF